MPDINWGGDSSTAPFSSRLDEANGDLILAKDNSGGTVLLEYDGSTWQYRGPVEMNGDDISGVGTLTATDVTVSGTVDAGAVSTGSLTSDSVNTESIDNSQDPSNQTTATFATRSNFANYAELGQESQVGTPAETIITVGQKHGLVIVSGAQISSGGTNFVDVILYNRDSGDVPVIQSNTSNNPASRSYSKSAGDVELAMGSDSYDITAVAQRVSP